MTDAGDRDWLSEIETFTNSLDDALEQSVVVSHVDRLWDSRQQFIEYLKDHIAVTKADLKFLERWQDQLRPAFKMRVIRQDLAASEKLLKQLES